MLFACLLLRNCFILAPVLKTLSSVIGNCWMKKRLSVHGVYVATIKPSVLLVVLYNIIPTVRATELHQSSHLSSHGVALCVNLQSCFEKKTVKASESQRNPIWAESSLVPWHCAVLWSMMLFSRLKGGDQSKSVSQSCAETVLWLKRPTVSGRRR